MGTSIHDGLLSLSFQLNHFVTAMPGSLFFGRVELQNGVLCYKEKELFQVTPAKLPEFGYALKGLAKNLVLTGKDTSVTGEIYAIEIGEDECMKIEKNRIVKISKSEVIFEITFNKFSFCDLMIALSRIAIFISNPSPQQYAIMQAYEKIRRVTEEMSFQERLNMVFTLEKDQQNEAKKFLLSEYLICHSQVLEFIFETNKLGGFNL